jgi:PIN domain nuclease of toxin-antitoxin system
MNLLLDTHVFIWFLKADYQLPPAWEAAIRDPSNTVYVSVVCIWEAVIKYYLNKLTLAGPPAIYLPRQRERHGMLALPLMENELAQLANLPNLHRDPFDRMLIAQALTLDLTLVTADAVMRAYPVKLLP